MTVKELIEELKKYPEGMTVIDHEGFLVMEVDKEMISGEEYVAIN